MKKKHLKKKPVAARSKARPRMAKKKQKAVVTGGAGFIGSHLVEALLKDGVEVTVIDNLATGHLRNLDGVKDDITLFVSDINDTHALRNALSGADVVFHLAAIPSVPRSIYAPLPSHDANIAGTFNVLLAARDLGVKRVVFSGSSSVYGENPAPAKVEHLPPAPRSPYAVQKLTGELYTMQFDEHFGVEGVVLRYFNVFGPRQDPHSPYAGVIPLFIKQMKEGKQPTINGTGGITRDFTYIDNVVDLNMRAWRTPEARGKVFNGACGESISLDDLVEAINAGLGTDIKPTYGPPRVGDIRNSLADITHAKKVLRYNPLVPFAEGIRRTVQSYDDGL